MNVVELKSVTKRFGHVAAVDSVSLSVSKGEIVSLLGPSGCGKTTTLRLIAGFEIPDAGAIAIGGRDVSGRRPYERNVGLLFQDYALFPHMSVAQNISYGLRRRGMDSDRVGRRLSLMLELVKLQGYEERRPLQLSGGQQQRVALARALATEPEVILLDEPLSALDAKLRQELRVELKEILSAVGTTAIVVTHDQEEAMSLASRIMVMNEGRIVQQGSPTDIYARPASKFVAEFVGRSNWFTARFGAQHSNGLFIYSTDDGFSLVVRESPGNSASSIEICVRPERIRVARGETPMVPEMNRLRGKVFDVAHLGADVHVVIELDSGRRILAIEKNAGQANDRIGDIVVGCFEASDCIAIPASAADVDLKK